VEDPGKVVIDEVAGSLIALLPIMPRLDSGLDEYYYRFLLFRLFDIVKPYPAGGWNRSQELGIMSDDIVAGAYAAVGSSSLAVLFNNQLRGTIWGSTILNEMQRAGWSGRKGGSLVKATSDKRLSDYEETEQDSNLENPSDDIGPSPDGLLDDRLK